MQELLGVGVLVTRPEQQALPLCRLLEARGALAFQLPAIDIQPSGDSAELRHRIAAMPPFDLVIFTSANAVRFGVTLLEHPPDAPLAVIGSATARALAQAGQTVTVAPAHGFDSESLLRHPALAQPRGRRVLIIKGTGGRDLLRTQLTHRGAEVTIADVYRRERAAHGAAALAAVAGRFSAN
jgi:uroporphyrinogen-III synthase